ncbi:MAG: hypothetical protein MUP22_04385 [Desulfobacterales bacterium]|nr:hypothetical protein [Desulfobacterales bacterium]
MSESRGCASSPDYGIYASLRQSIQGAAVVSYCEPWATQEKACNRLSRRVNKMEIK